jgi:hypothetical protein
MRIQLSNGLGHRALVTVALTFLAGVPHAAFAGKPVDLVLAVPAGKTLHYKIAQDTEGTYNGLPVGGMMRAELDVSGLEARRASASRWCSSVWRRAARWGTRFKRRSSDWTG